MEQERAGPSMRVAVTGSSGLIGSALVEALRRDGDAVTRLVRRPARSPDEVSWDPEAGHLRADDLAHVDAVVHLAGESIGARRWSDAQKERIWRSRVDSTSLLAHALARLPHQPALVVASAIGYYGDRGDERLREDSPAGTGFLAELSRAWEAAADPAREAGLRVVHVRTGIVLSATGGALERMLPLFRLGLGGRLGSGQQYWSWIALHDIVGVYHHALTSEVSGPLNGVAPNPVTNAAFTKTLARVLGRPAVLPVPRLGPRLLLGEMADELLFWSTRVVPDRPLASGYTFRHPALEEALHAVLDDRNAA